MNGKKAKKLRKIANGIGVWQPEVVVNKIYERLKKIKTK